MRCGLVDRQIHYNNRGLVTMCFLHIAHVFKGEEMREDAYLIPLCPRCHWLYDNPRKNPPGSIDDWFFIGTVARYFIEKESEAIERANLSDVVWLAEYVQEYNRTTARNTGDTS